MISSNELRQKYLDFFRDRGHAVIAGASLIPENDPSVLFTTAGMHPLVPYLLGETHASGKRLVNFQKCVRTDDIFEVGDATHHTLFEMLGNWSLGDYFKVDSIKWSYEFLISLGLKPELLAVSVFAGDDDAPFDEAAYNTWLELGIPKEKIARLPKKGNWWGPAGLTGPCGPDTEIFYWSGDPRDVPNSFNDDNDLWTEIWNNVFMEYEKHADGKYIPLTQKNVDTGMGFERLLSVVNGINDDYLTELFINEIKVIEDLSGKEYQLEKTSMRIIADHLKAAVFIIGDDKGAVPNNSDQGYIVRRLLRRALRHGRSLGIEKNDWMKLIAMEVILTYQDVYPELQRNHDLIISEISKEEAKFVKTLEHGLKEFQKMESISGEQAFYLFQSYGFPIEIIQELAKEKGIVVDEAAFNLEFKKHQDLSRTASAGKFQGGLADNSVDTTKLHTAAHLLLAALRKVLGDHITQKGSNITAERLRFDFSHSEKMTPAEIKQTEDLVNAEIKKNVPIICEILPIDQAKAKGAMGVFESKYGEEVKVYGVGDFSLEICGGPHVNNTAELGHFKIQKEESSSAGVRRIKAILE